MVMSPGQMAEFLVRLLEKFENGLIKIISPSDHAIHMVLLILDRAEKDGILQVHHLGDAAAFRTKEFALRGGGAIDHRVGSAKELTKQVSFGGNISALG